MKIYQVHEHGGVYEDKFDYILKSYLLEEKAMDEKERLEKIEEERRKCEQCPLYYCTDNCDVNCEKCNIDKVEETKKYCDKYKPQKDNKSGELLRDRCVHFYSCREQCHYYVEEIDVIE